MNNKLFHTIALAFILVISFYSDSSAQQNKISMDNAPIAQFDKEKFQGKWYSLTSIPTFLDKKWRKTIENYTLTKNGYDVLTTYHKMDDPEEKAIKSKLFFYDDKPDGDMKAQFWWPIKVSYRIIELADDYSYVVVGHTDKKYLFIMARQPKMDAKLRNEIVVRCQKAGYDTSKLVSQEHSK
jgi:apolipoprotein D and lipocalin family protein